jgi:hypothetical protein
MNPAFLVGFFILNIPVKALFSLCPDATVPFILLSAS